MIDYYAPLFSIDCLHPYYRDEKNDIDMGVLKEYGPCTDISIQPTTECRRQLDRYRLLYKQRGSGGIVIIPGRNTQTEAEPAFEPLIPLDAGIVFTFKIILKDPLFLNISDIAPGTLTAGSVFSFSNRTGTFIREEKGIRSFFIHKGRLEKSVPTILKISRYNIEHFDNPDVIDIYDQNSQLRSHIPIPEAATGIEIDLNGCPEGIYTISITGENGATAESVEVFVSNDALTPKLFGYLQVEVTEEMIAPGAKAQGLVIGFHSKNIYWTYKIKIVSEQPGSAEEDQLAIDKIFIDSREPSFTKTDMRLLDPKTVLLTFISETAVPLRKKPYTGIKLKKAPPVHVPPPEGEVGPGETVEPPRNVLVENMPNPSIDKLVKDGEHDDFDLKAEMSLTIRSVEQSP